MKLIDASAVITATLYDDEHEEFCQKEMTVKEYLDDYADEGCPNAVEAIPVKWIEEHIKWLISLGVAPSHQIRAMVERWKEER